MGGREDGMNAEITGPLTPRILIVDDDDAVRTSLARILRIEGLGEPILCGDSREVETLMNQYPIGVVLLDLLMPHLSGEQLLAQMAGRNPNVPVVVLTAVHDTDTAVRCIKMGAFDYLVKPVDSTRLFATVTKALRHYQLGSDKAHLEAALRDPELRHPECFSEIVTVAPAMKNLFRYLEAIAPSPEPVLIVGETGTGKELLARALHQLSGRSGDLVAVNVASIDDATFSDTLFGHRRGAFTGADRDREGLIEQAGEGTLLLDEIGDLGMEGQTRLLRVLQEREYYPIGSDLLRKSRCRFVATTNRPLHALLEGGRFRRDLYFRLQTHLIRVPPLRERPEDIPVLARFFLRQAANQMKKPVPTTPPEWEAYLRAYPFPGNVRELRSLVFDAVSRHQRGVLSLEALRQYLQERRGERNGSALPEAPIAFGSVLPTVDQMLDRLIAEALQRTQGNQGAAAQMLGISRRTIVRYLARRKRGEKLRDP